MSRKKARIPPINQITEDSLKKELFREIIYSIAHDYRIRTRFLFWGTTGEIGGKFRDDRPGYMKEADKEKTKAIPFTSFPVGTEDNPHVFFSELSKLNTGGGDMTISW